MSGICGWAGRDGIGVDANGLLNGMVRALDPRDTLSAHKYSDEYSAVALIPSDSLSVLHRDDEIVLVLDGYWCPKKESAQHEAQKLIDAYREHGVGVFDRLDGCFAMALLDHGRARALLAVDRFGTRPLTYTTLADGTLVFATTADSLLAHPEVPKQIDPQAIYHYLYFNMVPSPGAVYSGHRKLTPACYLDLRGGRLSVARYWQPRFFEDHVAISDTEAELRDALAHAVRRTDPTCVAGAFLSGGLDSSTVSGMLAQACARRPKTYSIGFDAAGFDEIAYARISAHHFGTEPHEYYVTPDNVADIAAIVARAYDEPFGNASAIPAYYCAQLAKQHGTNILLAGDGGDELFAGNARYAKQQLFELYNRVPSQLRRHALEPLMNLSLAERIAPFRKASRYITQAKIPLPDRLQTYNYLHLAPLEEIFEPDFLAALDAAQPLQLLRNTFHEPKDISPLNRMLYLDWKFTLADDDLRKVTRMCELAGVRVRFPMLDSEVVTLSTRIPSRLKLKGRQLRHFYKRAFRAFLPRDVLAKRKHGFGLPFGIWLRDSPRLRDLVHDTLPHLKQRGYLRSSYIDRIQTLHENEDANYYGVMLWVLLMLELWLDARV